MILMDYSSQYTGSSFGSDTLSGSMTSRQPRVRTIRLVRPSHGTLPPPGLTCRHGPSLGFSIRGGREHGTGFFVSNVELGSEANRQGLKIGDQIIRVNGFTVEDAVHKEVLQLISNHTHLTLKVRSVGMIPVKDKKTDPLSWQIISDYNSSTRSSPQLGEKIHDVRISIMVAPRTKLGCGICKGPEWKPGIFIQFTKEGGIAREAGLRPGDQILFCNNVDFSDIPFNEAVSIMKTSRQLDLIVRKSAGSELFPGESSGYNSSASSVTGDQSPSWSESKRLSIVKEESLDLEDRLSQLDRFKAKKWEKIEWDDDREEKPYHFKPTIINLSESGTTIKNNGPEECQNDEPVTNVVNKAKPNKIADICLVSHQHETKTVVVEVHRSDVQEKEKIEKNILTKSPSISSFASLTSRSSNTSSSLSSAICEEIQRRSERSKRIEKPSIDEQLQMKKILKSVDSDKQQRHTALMDEFRKAHRKMFKSNNNDGEENGNESSTNDTMDRHSGQDFTRKVAERLSNLSVKETPQEKSMTPSLQSNSGSVTSPPPPPPLPKEDLQNGIDHPPPITTSSSKTKVKAPPPPVPVKTSTLSHQPPPCPTPDYDTLSINSTSTLPKKSGTNGFVRREPNTSHNNDTVEMESLESFKLNSPKDSKPKPPSIYFSRPKSTISPQLSNGSASNSTLTKQRPVSVIIGEYPTGTSRKQPGKLDFLQNGHDNGSRTASQSISSQFASELAQTLSRSNLKKRTESMENLLNIPHIKSESNGSVRISVNSNLHKNFAKSTNDLTSLDNFSKAIANRVTINISSNDKKAETPSGILKNGNGSSYNIPSHRPVVHQKSITFGEMPTVINDHPLRVT